MTRRAQAAMEFLTTYGWAIMVVLVAIGALAYFGVFSPGKYFPERCIFSTGLNCRDAIARIDPVNGLQFVLILENGFGNGITIKAADQFAATFNGRPGGCTNGSLSLAAGEAKTYVCAGNIAPGTAAWGGVQSGQRAKATFVLNYTDVGGAFVHPASGEIQSVIS